ncbi:FKBP-type peptidyl-prolyl cis-trans isomerase [Pleionea sp. CnH1-48]|uniref:FKBP-type peptidyl-prolyl cis-trans isomerase n=1 Tax=Pleionea sp. CnH1-48 TaxID=2954494 RepID=UPI00209751AB|nr:FKBP-type peptidyl-prolyl cis-trans isomerase [Pleionea sp. CnH1-48]MCO7222875.1 FKBP-type peptidyl-prolyl cis-trans isomerase [Pleionea sp. CnH1-48]
MSLNNCIEADSRVLAHIELSVDDGSVVDSTRVEGKPSIIQLGNESLSPELEKNLMGMKVGDKSKFKVSPEGAYGHPQPDLIHFLDINTFASDIELKEGAIVAFEQPGGNNIPGIIREVQGVSVKVDFNHPLAGQSVTFDVEVVAINDFSEIQAG